MRWIWTSSALLATLVVSGLSFPHPDDHEYKIPTVGTGQRSQYYVLHKDGTFKYGFDTGDGAFESVKSDTLGSLDGKFGYVDPDGNTIELEYEAGREGFVARGNHLPKPSPELVQALAAVVQRSEPFVDPLAGGDSDASYGFKFQSDEHSRTEEADSDGTVTGSYSYSDENGVIRKFNYKAGKGIGFVIEEDDLNVPFETPGPSSIIRPSTKTNLPSRTIIPDFKQSTTYDGNQAAIFSTRSEVPGSSAYSFSYDADDHSRREVSDDNLNVEGSFSFIADDGKRRTLDYEAGSGRGFVAHGEHLPIAPELSFGDRLSHKTQSSQAQKISVKSSQLDGQRQIIDEMNSVSAQGPKPLYHEKKSSVDYETEQQAAVKHSKSQEYKVDAVQIQRLLSQGSSAMHNDINKSSTSFKSPPVSRQYEDANIRSSSSRDGSYTFSHDSSSHSRSESSDVKNNVVGEFEFVVDDDGEKRKIKYEAGATTGFIAEGKHIPIGPIVPGAPSGQPTGRIVPVVEVPFVDPLANSDSDASYNFKFDSETYSRSETADEDGNIVGTYTIVDDDGTRVTYRFRAGKGIGYENEEISRTKGPKPVKPIPYNGPLAFDAPEDSIKLDNSQKTIHYKPQEEEVTGVRSSLKESATRSTTYFKPSVTDFTPKTINKSNNERQIETELPKFTLNTYPASHNVEKFGYVLSFP